MKKQIKKFIFGNCQSVKQWLERNENYNFVLIMGFDLLAKPSKKRAKNKHFRSTLQWESREASWLNTWNSFPPQEKGQSLNMVSRLTQYVINLLIKLGKIKIFLNFMANDFDLGVYHILIAILSNKCITIGKAVFLSILFTKLYKWVF